MARTKKSRLFTHLEPNSEKKYKPNYNLWSNKYEFQLTNRVWDRLHTMNNEGKAGKCYLFDPTGSADMNTHWDNMEKEFLAYAEVQDVNDMRSNLKSFMAYRTITNIDARERRQEINYIIEERNEEDKGRAISFDYMVKDYFRRNPDIRYKFFDASKASKYLGNYFAYVPFTRRYRKVEVPKKMDITKEQIEKGEIPEQEYEKKMVVDFEDIDFIPMDPRDVLVDPNAEYLHGVSKAATDAAIILYLTPDQVKAMLSGTPNIKNLDKLDPKNTQTFGEPFFGRMKDAQDGYDELVIYWNKETDSEVIIYGDILLKESPIPYIDKMIPLLMFKCIRHPGQFWAMGLTDVIIQQSAEETALKNARIDQLKLASYPPIFAGTSVFGDIKRNWGTIEPFKVIEMPDVNQAKVFEIPGVPFDSFRISQDLKDEVVMNTGVNPQGLNLPMASTPATNTLAMKENMTDMINLYEDNLLDTMNDWGKMIISRISQFYSQPSMQRTLELGKKAMRELRLEDVELFKDKDGNWTSRNIKGHKVIELSKDMFDWKGFPRVYISGDFKTPISSAYRQRKAQEILPQLAPFAGEPGSMLPNGQPVVVNVRKLIKWYSKQMEVDEVDMIVDDNEDWIEEIKQAIEQNKKMEEGEYVPGVPGEPEAHRYQHATQLLILNDSISSEEFMLAQQAAQMGDLMAQMVVERTLKYRELLADHLRLDNLLVNDAAMVAVEQTDRMDNPQPEVPGNNSTNVPTVSGNQGLPNQGGLPVPSQQSEADFEGQVGSGMV